MGRPAATQGLSKWAREAEENREGGETGRPTSLSPETEEGPPAGTCKLLGRRFSPGAPGRGGPPHYLLVVVPLEPWDVGQ